MEQKQWRSKITTCLPTPDRFHDESFYTVKNARELFVVDELADGLKVMLRFVSEVRFGVSRFQDIAVVIHKSEMPVLRCCAFVGADCFRRL